MKNSFLYFYFMLAVIIPGVGFADGLELTKVGEWGTGQYEAVFVQGNYAYCAAGGAGLDIIDTGNFSDPRKVGNYESAGEIRVVYVSGSYAYVGSIPSYSNSIFEIIDIAAPSEPVRVGEYTFTGARINGIHISGNYAYLATGRQGLKVMDISNPSDPKLVRSKGTTDTTRDVYVWGNYVYLAEYYGGLRVMDISTPSRPVPAGTCVTSGRLDRVMVSGNYAYTVDINLGIQVIDISDPMNPVKAGSYELESAKDVFVNGNYAFAANGPDDLVVLDVSDPSAPEYVGQYDTPGEATGVVVTGGGAYVADSFGGLRVIDVSNPSLPFPGGNYNHSGYARDVHVKGKYAYLADGGSGLQIIDISNPSNPSRTANHNTDGGIGSVCVNGNYAYTGTTDGGLRIIDISNSSRPVSAGYCFTYGNARDVEIGGNYAYVAGWSGGLYIIDVSEPSNPTLVERILSGDNIESVAKSGNYVYTASGFQSGQLHIIDVSNPSSPTVVGSHLLLNLAGVGVYAGGDYAYVANTNFYIFDISNPSLPTRVGWYSITNSLTGGVFAANGYAYVTEYYDGLLVFDVSDPSSPTLLGNTNTPGIGNSVHVSGDYVYTADGSSGKLLIFSKVHASTPRIGVNRRELFFGAEAYGASTVAQSLSIENNGGGTLDWFVTADREWLNCSPGSGTNAGTVSVSADASGIGAGTYTGTVSVSAPNASNSPKTVDVTLTVYKKWETEGPFGEFTTPVSGSIVSAAVPFTGWVLDDIGVESVMLYRENDGVLAFVGEAVFVEGARPDVEAAYPEYPMNSKAGWGYMLLTNFLPDADGTFTIYAVATDREGYQVELGGKTIVVHNADAVKPFGAIDTPAQGGTASGGDYINYGWVLTPRPNTIPMDGSTIRVYVDGVELGNPAYNLYRDDIAALFPGYNNSGGAVGYFSLDTTQYENGVHTISWTAEDDVGNGDGIGSRYFNVQNSARSMDEGRGTKDEGRGSRDERRGTKDEGRGTRDEGRKRFSRFEMMPETQENPRAVQIGCMRRVLGELERVVLCLVPDTGDLRLQRGYMEVNGGLRKLPIGSTLDTKRGVFLWQPGPGFVGTYEFVFVLTDAHENETRKHASIIIKPRF